MFEIFDTNRRRYASTGVISSMPSELIDSIWFVIDYDLQGLFPLDNLLTFTLINNQGFVSIGFTNKESQMDITIDLPFRYVSGLPTEVHTFDDGTRETILLPSEIQQR
ncbi:hypothetical protein M2139_001869 [Enterococcus sp. PF1-24]|uniref:DUF960 domain-containing protein n=1 Tax=unclassified Enterococcus TaxID=2608891 RepID=UPI0024741D31|nr:MULTISPECIES: DUF960 domain-containing protein [unclassified Enterococcus]MDH6364868.1 hypothetical protein [Enterococcus sp. PFB1-1]MDH6401969.1 hypothetical protein [Enterococcus sp. PF1-24]